MASKSGTKGKVEQVDEQVTPRRRGKSQQAEVSAPSARTAKKPATQKAVCQRDCQIRDDGQVRLVERGQEVLLGADCVYPPDCFVWCG